ncbi:hypothetical protein [Asticcacaulis tiandongensis]|uniref:hypothetical protein n=1 Tax=Asticcacaulis tiandongensis TaxID=2565365 RepID=UPI00112CE28B|nr:hypothetical protein [Asticcacaulis tiandongensis]
MSETDIIKPVIGPGIKLKTIRNEAIGQVTLRLVHTGDYYVGLLIAGGSEKARVTGHDPDDVWKELRSRIGQASEAYFGFEGAIKRFRSLFPDGFSSTAFGETERNYKLSAKAKLDETAPLEQALTETGLGEAVLSVFRATNLLSPFEKARLQPLLRGPDADNFIQASAPFAIGDIDSALRIMERLLSVEDNAKWTVVTYLPFLWRPDAHMFLKPLVTCDFAVRVGHGFAQDYSPKLRPEVYASLLDMMAMTQREISELSPRDHIDLQSFVWVVGEYSDPASSVGL